MSREHLDTTSRRRFLAAGTALLALPIVGCSKVGSDDRKQATAEPKQTGASIAALSMTIHKDPSCACCTAWADMARKAGYRVAVTEERDMASFKRKLGVPDALWSCHTAKVGDYVFEGHVPLDDVARLLAGKDKAIAGLAVPGMPRGSPGMEMPDGSVDRFKVLAFSPSGEVHVFSGSPREG